MRSAPGDIVGIDVDTVELDLRTQTENVSGDTAAADAPVQNTRHLRHRPPMPLGQAPDAVEVGAPADDKFRTVGVTRDPMQPVGIWNIGEITRRDRDMREPERI